MVGKLKCRNLTRESIGGCAGVSYSKKEAQRVGFDFRERDQSKMKESDQAEHLDREITKTVTRFRQEYEITYAAAIGVMRLQAARLEKEVLDEEEDND